MLRFINVVYQGFVPLLQERLIFNSDANWKIHIESIITSEKNHLNAFINLNID